MRYTVPELMLLITAVSAAIVSIITAWRTKGSIEAKVETASKITQAKVDTAITEVGKVHVLTNDRATKADTRIESLEAQIKLLIATIATKDQQAAIIEDRASQKNLVTDLINAQTVKTQTVETQVVKKTEE